MLAGAHIERIGFSTQAFYIYHSSSVASRSVNDAVLSVRVKHVMKQPRIDARRRYKRCGVRQSLIANPPPPEVVMDERALFALLLCMSTMCAAQEAEGVAARCAREALAAVEKTTTNGEEVNADVVKRLVDGSAALSATQVDSVGDVLAGTVVCALRERESDGLAPYKRLDGPWSDLVVRLWKPQRQFKIEQVNAMLDSAFKISL